MTSNYDIIYLLQNKKKFLGCFHIKKLPPHPTKLPASLIIFINNHWVSLLLVNKDLCLYFDSFGEGIQDKHLIEYLKPLYKKVTINKVKLQDDESNKCGLFCSLFVAIVHNRKDFKRFLNLFDKNNLLTNDHILYHIYMNMNKLT